MVESQIAVTKFTIPPTRRHLLPRSPLIASLNQSRMLPLVLLSASAGSGKTTLLAAWAGQHAHPVAWLSLDSLDNDPLHFWSVVMMALRTRFPSIGEEASARLRSSQSPDILAFLTLLINDLVASEEEITLILDDYHEIEEPTIHASLMFLFTHAPSCLHLILSSRIDPPLALSRLRARGLLAELRDADLRLNEQEATDFLRHVMGLHLDTDDEQRLARRTDGWLVGLQLAALSLSRSESPSEWVQAFSGNQRLVLDYLQEEILSRQESPLRRFLLRVCILPRMNASLCQAVTGRANSRQMFDVLERRNLFIFPLDEQRHWYRLHDLFREALLAQLHATQPELVPVLYERAAHWYEQHGLLPDAIDAALKARAFPYAVELIERSVDTRSLRNAYHTLCYWLGHMPDTVIQAHPALSFLYALAIMFTTQRRDPVSWERIEQLLIWAEQGFEASAQPERLGDALELHAELVFFQEDIPTMLTLARHASQLLTESSIMTSMNFLTQGYEHLLAGDVDVAWKLFLEGYSRCERLGNLTATLAACILLGEVCFLKGELRRASSYYQQALRYAQENSEVSRQQFTTGTGDRETFFVSWTYHNLARLSYEENDLEAAQHYLSQSHAIGDGSTPVIHVLSSGSLVQTRLLCHFGEMAQAMRLLETWEGQARFPWVLRAIRAGKARLNLASGHLSAVEQWARSREDSFGFTIREHERELPYVQQEEEALLLIRLHLARGKAKEALQEVMRWKEKAQAQGRQYVLLEMLMLESLAYVRAHELTQAQSTLMHALKLAQPENYQRLFLDEGPMLAELLHSTLPSIQEPALEAFVHCLLDAFEREQVYVSPPVTSAPQASLTLHEPLTPQERRVLHLLAEGASNQQIANQLVISLATVRKHVSNILGKLGAANRTQAIVRAREYALL